jgi:hypothetical protein
LDVREKVVGDVLGDDRAVAGDDRGGVAAVADDLDLGHAGQLTTSSARSTCLRAFCASIDTVLRQAPAADFTQTTGLPVISTAGGTSGWRSQIAVQACSSAVMSGPATAPSC